MLPWKWKHKIEMNGIEFFLHGNMISNLICFLYQQKTNLSIQIFRKKEGFIKIINNFKQTYINAVLFSYGTSHQPIGDTPGNIFQEIQGFLHSEGLDLSI